MVDLNRVYKNAYIEGLTFGGGSNKVDKAAVDLAMERATSGGTIYEQGISAKEDAQLRGYLTGINEKYVKSDYLNSEHTKEHIDSKLQRLEDYKSYDKNSEYLAQDRADAQSALDEANASKPKWYQRFTLGKEEYERRKTDAGVNVYERTKDLNEAQNNVVSPRTIADFQAKELQNLNKCMDKSIKDSFSYGN